MISAIVLAAGRSRRMGTQKMFLAWGDTTVIGKVIQTLVLAGVSSTTVVSGGNHAELVSSLVSYEVQLVHNKDYADGEMLTSIQVGLRAVGESQEATLVVLGDQPQIEVEVVQALIQRNRATSHAIIVPSHKMHRGHPWLLGKPYWSEILALRPPQTLRDFLNTHEDQIDYVMVDSQSILQDLDTIEDYSKYKP